MKRYGNLMTSITTKPNLNKAHVNAKRGKSTRTQVKKVEEHLDEYLEELQTDLVNGSYATSDYTVFTKLDRNKVRLISKLPYYPDRITHWAIMQIIEDILIKSMIPQTCAALPNRGEHRALIIETKYLTEHPEDTKYCLKLDVHKYFQSIDKEILREILRRKFKDDQLLDLLDEIIYSYELDGIPIGNYLSQYYANLYLTYFDHFVKEVLKVKYYIRYMDDMVLFAKTKEQLHEWLIAIDNYLTSNLNLELKSNYQIFPVDERGVDFVGYRHFRSYVLLRKSTAIKFKRISLKIQKKGYVNDHDYASINSYLGILKWCDSYRIRQKYIKPIKHLLISYQIDHKIKHKSKKGEKPNVVIQACKEYRKKCKISGNNTDPSLRAA